MSKSFKVSIQTTRNDVQRNLYYILFITCSMKQIISSNTDSHCCGYCHHYVIFI